MRFCFYSGYRDLKGGHTTLFITLIKGLTLQKKEVILINYKDGLISNELKKLSIKIKVLDLDELDVNSIPNLFSPTDVFVITFFNEFFRNLRKVNPRLIYYDINDYISGISDYKFGIKLPLLSRKLITKLLNKNGIVFMDDTGVFNIRMKFGINIENPKYLPIPIAIENTQNRYLSKLGESREVIHVTYLCRSVPWKLKVLEKILDDCTALNQQFRFHILVDDEERFNKSISLTRFLGGNIKFNISANLPPSEIEDFLLKNSDMNFGMGTTALHSAALGIPTVLVDYSESTFPQNYSYRWLYESKCYSLGLNLQKRESQKGMRMSELIGYIKEKEKNIEVSHNTFSYVNSNHESREVVKKLISFADITTFRMKDTKWLIPYYFMLHRISKHIFKFQKSLGAR